MPPAYPVQPAPTDRTAQMRLMREQQARLDAGRGVGPMGPGRAGAPYVDPSGTGGWPQGPRYNPPADPLPPRAAVPQGAAPVYGLDQNTAAMNRLADNIGRLYQQQRIQQRIRLLQMMGDPSLPPTYFPPLVTGDTILGLGYQILYRNQAAYVVGFDILVQWATAGARIRLSMNESDNGWFFDLDNGGPAGGYGNQRVLLKPNQIVFIRDNGGGASKLAIGDVIHRRICDPNDLLQDPAWVQDMGYTLGVKP